MATIREAREERGWSQEELGRRAGLHRNYIGGIEQGSRNVAVVNLLKLSVALEDPILAVDLHRKRG